MACFARKEEGFLLVEDEDDDSQVVIADVLWASTPFTDFFLMMLMINGLNHKSQRVEPARVLEGATRRMLLLADVL